MTLEIGAGVLAVLPFVDAGKSNHEPTRLNGMLSLSARGIDRQSLRTERRDQRTIRK